MTEVSITRDDTGETRELELLDLGIRYVTLKWPLGDALQFVVRSGHGLRKAMGWRITEESRAALGLEKFHGGPPRPKPGRLRGPTSLRPEQLRMFKT